MPTPSQPPALARRTLVRSVAWTTPVVAVGAVVPQAAASVCAAPVVTESSFSRSADSGSFASASGTYADQWQQDGDKIRRYSSWQDNSSKATLNGNGTIGGTAATKTLTTTLAVIPGATYTFTFTAMASLANINSTSNANAAPQWAQILIGGTVQWTGQSVKSGRDNTAFPGDPGGIITDLPTATAPDTILSSGKAGSYKVTYTVPAGTTTLTFAIKYILAPSGDPKNTGTNIAPGGDDLSVSLPTIACAR